MVKVSIDMNCVNNILNSADASSKLTNNIVQGLKDSGVALTQFADSSSDETSDKSNINISNIISTKIAQECLTNITSTNRIQIVGYGNTVEEIHQESVIAAIAKCLSSNKAILSAAEQIADNSNQTSEHSSENPLKPFTDMISGLGTNMMIIIAIIVIAIVAVIGLFIWAL